jgi:hypothetical protein
VGPAALGGGLLTQQVEQLRVGEHNTELFDMYPDQASALFLKVQQSIEKLGYSEDDCIDISQLQMQINKE